MLQSWLVISMRKRRGRLSLAVLNFQEMVRMGGWTCTYIVGIELETSKRKKQAHSWSSTCLPPNKIQNWQDHLRHRKQPLSGLFCKQRETDMNLPFFPPLKQIELNSKWKKKPSSLFRKHTETPIAQKSQIIAGSQGSCKICMHYVLLFSLLIFVFFWPEMQSMPYSTRQSKQNCLLNSTEWKDYKEEDGEQTQWGQKHRRREVQKSRKCLSGG